METPNRRRAKQLVAEAITVVFEARQNSTPFHLVRNIFVVFFFFL